MKIIKNRNKKQKGVAAVITALCLTVLLGIAAISVDLATYYLRNNELQNAADAGALAGARVLYDPVTGLVNATGFTNENGNSIPSANQVGHDTAEANVAQGEAVEVYWVSGNTGDVKRGHWSFKTRTFTPSDATEPVNTLQHTFDELDNNTNFINAVEVTTRRKATPLITFFSKIFGNSDLEMETKAVAYLGFSGQILPLEADLPIVICEDTLYETEDPNVYNCNIGRMTNSGNNLYSNDTARWTDWNWEATNGCRDNEGVGSSEVNKLIDCEAGSNPNIVPFGAGLPTNNGEMNALSIIEGCYQDMAPDSANGIYKMWEVTLPVTDCTKDPGCAKVLGMVRVYIAWVNYNQPESHYEPVPKFMYAPTTEDEYGNPDYIRDENGDPYFVNWPGEYPDGDPTQMYNYVEDVWTTNEGDLIDFMLDLYNYYVSTNKGDYINIGDEIEAAYGAGWQTDPSLVESFFIQGADDTRFLGSSDPNSANYIDEVDIDAKVRWASFIYHYNLQNINEDESLTTIQTPAPWKGSAIYFLPSCDVQVPRGVSGGMNFGILAKIPVLVD